MNDYQFGNFLYELRSEKGLSQSELGALLGVTNKAVSKWENGSAKPNTNLLPKIAQIFDVSIEELFAGKRIEKEGELQKVKDQLGKQKKKYVILSSIYLSFMFILPLLLILFIAVVSGFDVNDEILGPLGSISLILLFIVSTVSYIIYSGNYRSVKSADMPTRLQPFLNRVALFKKIARIVIFVCIIFMLLAWIGSMYLPGVMADVGQLDFVIGILCSVVALLAIAALGILVFVRCIMRFLGVGCRVEKKEREKIEFSQMPLWYKILYIASKCFAINVFVLSIAGISHSELITARIVFSLLFVVSYLPILIYMIRHTKKK